MPARRTRSPCARSVTSKTAIPRIWASAWAPWRAVIRTSISGAVVAAPGTGTFARSHRTCAEMPVVGLRIATVTDIEAMHAIRLAVTENRVRDASHVTTPKYRRMLGERGKGWVFEGEA